MDAKEIVSSINKIYSQFNIPNSLQLHQLRVAGVSELICDNWKGPRVDRTEMLAALLIHDLGNIVKFDFRPGMLLPLGEEKDADYWQRLQKDTIARYGSDDHAVTMKMAEEIGIDERISYLLEEISNAYHGIETLFDSEDWGLKVAMYSDCRVAPSQIVSVEGRFIDLMERRRGKPVEAIYRKLLPEILELEENIFAKVAITPEGINDATVEPYVLKYKQKMKTI